MSKSKNAEKNAKVVSEASSEHGAILAAQRKFEAAVVAAAVGREREWAERVLAALQRLRETLIVHCESVEKPDGLLTEIHNAMLTVNERLTQAREYHARLPKDCDELSALLEARVEGGPASINELRKHAASLMTDIRHHQACEADLVFEAFERDLGSFD